jgi:hypothetical protein
MRSNRSRRSATATGLAALALAGLAATAIGAKAPAAPKGPTPDITVRVEGLTKTLLEPTTVTLKSGGVTKGTAADSCSGLSALGALQDATKGDWGGTWSSSYKDYLITSIRGTTYGESADYYWAFWLDNKPAPVGACSVDPAKGSSILFFPEYDGKSKSITAPAVLGISAPASAITGKPFQLIVTSYANTNGKPTPAAGAKVTAGATSTTTNARGTATLKLTKGGNTQIEVTAPNALRDETTVCIHSTGATCPKS